MHGLIALLRKKVNKNTREPGRKVLHEGMKGIMKIKNRTKGIHRRKNSNQNIKYKYKCMISVTQTKKIDKINTENINLAVESKAAIEKKENEREENVTEIYKEIKTK